jgi:AraC family transcriptional regulator, regulatory protein of adaptative response / DNA-3-methyladenine glycosylase II
MRTPGVRNESWMRDRFYARDRQADGIFLTGVLTTGIYCRPSCPAKKPLPENLRFFRSREDALQNGFRACLRCRPDDHEMTSADAPERFEWILGRLRSELPSIDDLTDLSVSAEVGRTRIAELFRMHLQTTPRRWLRREKLSRAADEIAGSRRTLSTIAAEAGFASDAAFHTAMKREYGVTPASLREASSREIELVLPRGFRADLFLAAIARDSMHPSERADATSFRIATRALEIDGVFRSNHLRLTWQQPQSPRGRWEIARAVAQRLGIAHDPASFEKSAPAFFRSIISSRSGLRPVVMASPFDALVWAIAGQAVSRHVASILRRKLVEKASSRLGTLHAPPDPRRIAQLAAEDLDREGFTRAKARTIVDVSRRVASGELDLRPDRSIAGLRRDLARVRGIGEWTTEYVLLRGFGHSDVVPPGDAGLRGAVMRWKESKERPAPEELEQFFEPFRGRRSFAVEHLWWWNDEEKRNAIPG